MISAIHYGADAEKDTGRFKHRPYGGNAAPMDMTPQLFDSVELVVPMPDEPYAGSHPPADWRGLAPGDRGAVVEVFETPPGYIIEFFRDGKTVAITDVTPEQVRVTQRHVSARTPEPAQRIAD